MMNRVDVAGMLDLIDDDFLQGIDHLDKLIEHLATADKDEDITPDLYFELVAWRDAMYGAYMIGPEV